MWWCVEDGSDDGEDGGGGCGFPSCGLGWSLLAFIFAGVESVPIEGDRYLIGETRVKSASRLPERNSCHR